MKILTAIGNEELNERLKEEEEIEVIGKDIQYQEGILEMLEERKDIDCLAVSNNLPEEMNFLYLIDRIRKENEKLEIIVFLDKEDIKIENFLNSKKIYKIYYLDENGIEVFINSIRNYKEIDINSEIEELKKVIVSPKYERETKTIVVSGVEGSGKSIISCILAKQLEKNKKSVAIVSLDDSNSVEIIFGVRSKKEETKTSKKITLIGGLGNIENENIDSYMIRNLIEKLKKRFDYIIVDTSSNLKYKYINTVLECSDKIVFLLEPNILEISKAKNMLEVIINDLNIEADKIKIVFNKTNKYQIAESILEEVFCNFEKIGEIKYSEKYNMFINQHLSVLDVENMYEVICQN